MALPDHSSALTSRAVKLRRPTDVRYMQVTLARSAMLSQDLWKWYREIPEIHYSISRNARIAGYAKLFPTKRNADGDYVRIDSSSSEALTSMDKAALQIVGDIQSPYGGLSGLIERFYALRKVPADAWLIADRRDGAFHGYHFLSPGELTTSKDGAINQVPWFEVPTDPDAKFELWWRRARAVVDTEGDLMEKIARADVLGRVWAPHPEYIDEPDSALSAVSFECDLLYQSTRLMMAKIKQRLAMGGMLFLPSGVRHANAKNGEADLLKTIAMALTTNVKNLEDSEALAPILLEGDGSLADQIRFLQSDNSIFETDIEIRRELIGRVMFGLDNQKQATSGEAQSHFQSWQCMSSDTEIYTERGWKRHDEVQPGDVVMTLNHDTGLSEWNVVEHMNRYSVTDEPMLSIETHNHSSLSTMNHRWPVLHRTTENMEVGRYRRWKTSSELGQTCQLITGAPSADIPTEAKYTDEFVELVAWSWTEGTSGEHFVIHQSSEANPENCDRIRRCLTALYGPPSEDMHPLRSTPRGEGHHSSKLTWGDVLAIRSSDEPTKVLAERYGISQSSIDKARRGVTWKHPDRLEIPAWAEKRKANGMACWSLTNAAAAPIREVAPGRVVGLDFIRSLTASQLELFLLVSGLADGHWQEGKLLIGQKNPVMLDALELAAILLGRRVTRGQRRHQGFTDHLMHTLYVGVGAVSDLQSTTPAVERYTGTVWCPTTKNGTWLARRNSKVFYTGNSADDERRISVMPDVKAMTHPLAKLVLVPKLIERFPGADAEAGLYGVGADLDDAATKTNQAEDARQAHDRVLLKRIVSNRKQGFEDEDLLDENTDEYVRQVGLKAGDPYLAVYGTPHVDRIDWDKVGNRTNRGAEPNRQGDDPKAGPGVGDPGSPNPADRRPTQPRTQRPT